MKINGRTKILGVAGYPVSHTLSPKIHNYLIEKYKLNLVYLPLEIIPEKFEDFVRGLTSMDNFSGLNITVPFKEAILPYLNFISPEAQIIKAVNTVMIIRSRLRGFNTDWYGFKQSMKINFPDFQFKKAQVILLGAGGASRAVAYALLQSRIKKLVITDILHQKALKLKKHLLQYFKNSEIQVQRMDFHFLSRIDFMPDLIVNATSHGLRKGDGAVIDLDPVHHERTIIHDLIYNPCETGLLKRARQSGLKRLNGLDMLILQALYSFSIWTGLDLEEELLRYLKPLRDLCS